jgi:protein-S-isoprenylcysteine O-methyltransferase Ste14
MSSIPAPNRPAGRGTAWVIAQAPLLLVAILLPVLWRPAPFNAFVPRWVAIASRVVGVAGIASSLAVAARAKSILGKGLVVFPKPPDDAVLREDDIYGIVRHPVYVAVIGATLSWALVWLSLPGLLFFIPTPLFFRVKSQHEEQFLVARFPEYGMYQKQVPAFVPKWRQRVRP